jgi:hypothetical protein
MPSIEKPKPHPRPSPAPAETPVKPVSAPPTETKRKALAKPVRKQTAAAESDARGGYDRRTFDFYTDQIKWLTRTSLEEKLNGEEGSMNAMVREAIDDYIAKRRKK